MNCKIAQKLISLHIDNKLSLQEVNELNNHLNSCNECRNNYNDLKKIKSILSAKNEIALSSDFTKSTMDKILALKDIQPTTINVGFSKKYFAIAASFIFVVLASVYFSINQPNQIYFESSDLFNVCEQTDEIENIYYSDITDFLC